jgi:hypothetical protein
MGEREVAALEKSNEANGSGEVGGTWGGQGCQGRAGRTRPDWVGLGRAGSHRGSKPTTRTTIKQTPITNRKLRRNKTDTQYQTKKGVLA